MVAIEGFWQESDRGSVLRVALAVISGGLEIKLETAGKLLSGDQCQQFMRGMVRTRKEEVAVGSGEKKTQNIWNNK